MYRPPLCGGFLGPFKPVSAPSLGLFWEEKGHNSAQRCLSSLGGELNLYTCPCTVRVCDGCVQGVCRVCTGCTMVGIPTRVYQGGIYTGVPLFLPKEPGGSPQRYLSPPKEPGGSPQSYLSSSQRSQEALRRGFSLLLRDPGRLSAEVSLFLLRTPGSLSATFNHF